MDVAPFVKFWKSDRTRNEVLSYLPKDDLASMRLVCRDFAGRVAASLFKEIKVNFRTTTFTRQARIAALERVGRHVAKFHFTFAHTSDTFLPPLIDSDSGEVVGFIYEPCIHSLKDPLSRRSFPSYGSWEMTDLLVRQYPPLFHAAANVPSFIRAFTAMKNLTHLVISCPSEDAGEAYRRSTVDYALISLRIAVERCRLERLKALSLLDIHPEAAPYLNPVMGFGALPNSRRRWRQVRKLKIQMRSSCSSSMLNQDHLKHLRSYLNIFSHNLRRLEFKWLGERRPCPVSVKQDPIRTEAGEEVDRTSRFCASRSLRFHRLRDLKVENVTADAVHIARFIARHHRAVRHTQRMKLKFNDVSLRSGTWNEALEPLTQMSGSTSWKSSSEESSEESMEEYMDVPIMFSPVDEREHEMQKVWRDRVCHRGSKPYHGGLSSLQRAGVRTKELLFGTEDHMRKLFNSTVFGWR